jgi:hypothetical protein
MEKRFNGMRTPLENFYKSLTDEQRHRFDAMGGSTRKARRAGPTNELASLCNEQSESFTQLPLQRIDQTIQPTQQQQGSSQRPKDSILESRQRARGILPN